MDIFELPEYRDTTTFVGKVPVRTPSLFAATRPVSELKSATMLEAPGAPASPAAPARALLME